MDVYSGGVFCAIISMKTSILGNSQHFGRNLNLSCLYEKQGVHRNTKFWLSKKAYGVTSIHPS